MPLRGFSILLTASQAAERLGVPVQRILALVASGRLRVAAQDEDGRVLIREHLVQELAADLDGPAARDSRRGSAPHNTSPAARGKGRTGLLFWIRHPLRLARPGDRQRGVPNADRRPCCTVARRSAQGRSAACRWRRRQAAATPAATAASLPPLCRPGAVHPRSPRSPTLGCHCL